MFTSVALCTYNGSGFLQQQLESIFNQTVPVNEIIICDEKSTDNTIAIIDAFRKTYPDVIQLHINEERLGVVKNFEKALTLCKGDIIFFSDQGDVWKSNKVEECINYFSKHPELDAVFSDADLIDDSGRELGQSMWDLIQFKKSATTNKELDLLQHLIFHGNVVTGACLAVRKKAKELILPFEEIGDLFHDEYIALKLADKNKISFITQSLIQYRVHGNQQSNVLKHKSRTEANAIKRAVLSGESEIQPLEYYRYWKRRMKAVDFLQNHGVRVKEHLIKELRQRRKKGLIAYYQTFNYYQRKKALLHEFFKGKEDISIADVLIK